VPALSVEIPQIPESVGWIVSLPAAEATISRGIRCLGQLKQRTSHLTVLEPVALALSKRISPIVIYIF
jgi:hypothetical protein